MADTPAGETVTPEAPSNEPSTAVAPPADNNSADVEAAKKEAEQARIRANQLANELEKLKAEKEAAERKKLEEKEEFKSLYEQTQAQLKEIQDAQAAQERQAELTKATADVLKEYPQTVQDLAVTAGLTLSDDSEAGVAAFKEKLDAIKAKVPTPTATPNNPRPVTPEVASKEELMARIRGGDKEALGSYIREIPGIKRMKEIAQNGA